MLYRLRPNLAGFALALILVLAAAFSGCAQLGLPTPQTMNEKIAAAQGSVTQVRSSATQLLVAKKITSTDAENVLKSTDAAAEGVAVARTIATTDPAGANFKLTAAVTILTALQTYLATKGN